MAFNQFLLYWWWCEQSVVYYISCKHFSNNINNIFFYQIEMFTMNATTTITTTIFLVLHAKSSTLLIFFTWYYIIYIRQSHFRLANVDLNVQIDVHTICISSGVCLSLVVFYCQRYCKNKFSEIAMLRGVIVTHINIIILVRVQPTNIIYFSVNYHCMAFAI